MKTPYIKWFQLLAAVEQYQEDLSNEEALSRLDQACISFVGERYGVKVLHNLPPEYLAIVKMDNVSSLPGNSNRASQAKSSA